MRDHKPPWGAALLFKVICKVSIGMRCHPLPFGAHSSCQPLSLVIISLLFLFSLSHVNAQEGNDTGWARSHILENAGAYPQSAALMEGLIEEGIDREYAYLRLAWLHYIQRNYNDATRLYHTALEINPHSLSARLGITLPLLATSQWKAAASYALQVLEISPWHYTAHMRLLVAEEGQRNWKQLAKHAAELAARYPEDSAVLIYLARARIAMGQIAGARSAYLRLLRRNPNNREALAYVKLRSALPVQTLLPVAPAAVVPVTPSPATPPSVPPASGQ